MLWRVANIAFLFLFGVSNLSVASPLPLANITGAPPQQQPPEARPMERGFSFMGFFDQEEVRDVVMDDRTPTPIAHLVADGFPAEGFAKHLGHKVTVRGTSSTGGNAPLSGSAPSRPSATRAPRSHPNGRGKSVFGGTNGIQQFSSRTAEIA